MPRCGQGVSEPSPGEESTAEESTAEDDSISIIIAAHDNADSLRSNLPLLLKQDYHGHYEVIVVDEASTDSTADVLTLMKSEHSLEASRVSGATGATGDAPHFYTTFLPASSHYLSRRKMAMTLGAKAAKGKWLVFVDADCRPSGSGWLNSLASHFNQATDMVMGNVAYQSGAKPLQRFVRFVTQCYAMRRAQRGMAYRHWGGCLAVRRSVFDGMGGFAANRHFLRGEYDFMVNEFAQPGRTDVALEPQAAMEQLAPSRKAWLTTTLTYMETRRHLHRSMAWRLLHVVDQLALHVSWMAIAMAVAYSALTGSGVVAMAAAVALIVTVLLRMVIARKALAAMSQPLPLWCVPIMELMVLWYGVFNTIRYLLSDRRDYMVNI